MRFGVSERRSAEVASSPAATLSAYRRAVVSLGWEIVAQADDRLVAMEVPFRLECGARPAVVELGVRPARGGGTTVTMKGARRGRRAGELGAQLDEIERRARERLPAGSGPIVGRSWSAR